MVTSRIFLFLTLTVLLPSFSDVHSRVLRDRDQGLAVKRAARYSHAKKSIKKSHAKSAQDTSSIKLIGEIAWDGPVQVAADNVPAFTVFFAGNRTVSRHNGLFELKIDKEDQKFLEDMTLILCKRSEPTFSHGNTLEGMTIEKLGKCMWYNIALDERKQADKSIYYWNIQEKQDVKPTDMMPENALIIMVSPSRVVRIEDVGQLISGHTVLPRIVISTDQAKAHRAETKSAIEAIPFRHLTGDRKMATKQVNGVDICQPVGF